MNWQQYITSDPAILLGKPVLKGTRISVELILELLEEGWTKESILKSYPHLTSDSIAAVYSFLKECMQNEFYFLEKAS